MKIVVCVKQVPDSEAKVSAEGEKISWGEAPLVINPFDEYAVEAALLQKEAAGGTVTAVTGDQRREVAHAHDLDVLFRETGGDQFIGQVARHLGRIAHGLGCVDLDDGLEYFEGLQGMLGELFPLSKGGERRNRQQQQTNKPVHGIRNRPRRRKVCPIGPITTRL